MDKATSRDLTFRRDLDADLSGALPAISDSYSEFMNGVYKVLTLGKRYYRPVGPDPVPSSAAQMRENINETIDASVFERWRADKNYRPQNLKAWAVRRSVDISAITTSVMADTPSQAV